MHDGNYILRYNGKGELEFVPIDLECRNLRNCDHTGVECIFWEIFNKNSPLYYKSNFDSPQKLKKHCCELESKEITKVILDNEKKH